MKRQLSILLAAGFAMAVAAAAWGEIPAVYSFALREIGDQPAVLDALRSPAFSSYYREDKVKSGLAVNPATETVYATSLRDNNRVHRFDPDSESPADSPIESSIGLVEKGVFTTDYGFYLGSVLGGVHETDHGNMKMVFVTFNPLIVTGNHGDGAFVTFESVHSRRFGEFIAQSPSEEPGEMNEGTLSSPVDTAARVSFGYIQDSTYTFGSNNGVLGWCSYIAFDLHRGVFTLANDQAGAFRYTATSWASAGTNIGISLRLPSCMPRRPARASRPWTASPSTIGTRTFVTGTRQRTGRPCS